MNHSRMFRVAGVASALALAAVACADDTDEFDQTPGNGEVPGEEVPGENDLDDDFDNGFDDDFDDGLDDDLEN